MADKEKPATTEVKNQADEGKKNDEKTNSPEIKSRLE
jgi:hypothetical protein